MQNHKCNINSVDPITKRGDEVRVLISPKTVGATQLIMGVAKLKTGETVAPHLHDYSEECFFVLKGQGTLHLESGECIDFSPGDAVIVPKGVVHWVENSGDHLMEIVFASAPLAPRSTNGHRDLQQEKKI